MLHIFYRDGLVVSHITSGFPEGWHPLILASSLCVSDSKMYIVFYSRKAVDSKVFRPRVIWSIEPILRGQDDRSYQRATEA